MNPIVYVDDSENDIYLFKSCVSRHKKILNNVLSFSSGDDFLKYITKQKNNTDQLPVLVLLDINMPALSGFDILEEIKKLGSIHKKIIICVFTASTHKQDMEKSIDLGANYFFCKPYGIDEYMNFLDQINQIIDSDKNVAKNH